MTTTPEPWHTQTLRRDANGIEFWFDIGCPSYYAVRYRDGDGWGPRVAVSLRYLLESEAV
jgi:hypothetical protein